MRAPAAARMHAGRTYDPGPRRCIVQASAQPTVTPGASMGTSTMLCCWCAGAPGSLLPMKMQMRQRGSHAPLVHLQPGGRVGGRGRSRAEPAAAFWSSTASTAASSCSMQPRPQPAALRRLQEQPSGTLWHSHIPGPRTVSSSSPSAHFPAEASLLTHPIPRCWAAPARSHWAQLKAGRQAAPRPPAHPPPGPLHPPLLAVQDEVGAVHLYGRPDVGGVAAGHLALGHGKGRADLRRRPVGSLA
jgi:hypothetical protein